MRPSEAVRSVPGTARTVSSIGIAVDPTAATSPDADRSMVALLRRARAEGMTVFDAAGATSPARAERLIATAFPHADPDLFVIVRASSGTTGSAESAFSGGAPRTPSAPVATELRAGLRESAQRLAPQVPAIVEWRVDPGDLPGDVEAAMVALEAARTAGEVEACSLRVPPGREALSAVLGRSPSRLLSVELSLLTPSLTRALDAADQADPLAVLVRDPFSNGLLDGRRFTSALSDRSPRSAPVDVRALRAEFTPVLSFDFLTSGRRRTLPQATLQYFLTRRWVTSVLVPLPPPERWTDVFGLAGAPPLSPEEVTRIDGGAHSE
jgi:aryl-alcohol dehydrogenase-like predicted oxidoreductase